MKIDDLRKLFRETLEAHDETETLVGLDVNGASVGLSPEQVESIRAGMEAYGRSLAPAVVSGALTMKRAEEMCFEHAAELTDAAMRSLTVSS